MITDLNLPEIVESESQLDALLTRPSDALVDFIANREGDLIILGIAGKMGVSLGHLAVRAIERAGVRKTVYGVARFSRPESQEQLESIGVKTIQCDLLNRAAVAQLPQIKNVLFMVGRKFGTAGAASLTWAMNTIVPANVTEHFRQSSIVAFSTGCVYPLVRIGSAPNERVAPEPIGEYAQSCLGRERVFEYGSRAYGTPVCLYRLNYSIDLRYGVLHDIAEKIQCDEPVDLGVPAFNVIWQGDANTQALMCLGHCSSPANILNVTGPETLTTKDVAEQLGQWMGMPVRFTGKPSDLSYLSDSARATALFGAPSVAAEQLIRWQAHWSMMGGRSLGKPTHFTVTDGSY
ncbi:NAD-dependent epimerase/dehydratase family protein [Novipirellula artificiosorum]|uniref:NAD dependent epimerase/dehydratase family protein n=1 Tax=Novipirellula artificiosorum TaxID=2528016 RepID=A0A5C6D380_9BACT|nr:NAD-dependent epimerase/dehydratase family protein [Novipirellula artificiosorum]TWU31392.1 NAD dependent epimerase/dehydratase family protein [Novipirellula artificiosorum]